MKLIIAEKPSVANGIAPVVGAIQKRNGYVEGNGYLISWCFGHLIGLRTPDEYCEEWAEKHWTFDMLPMFPENWKLKVMPDKKEQLMILKNLMNDSRVDEIICATDADREGELIFRYVYILCRCKKPVKRLWISSLEESAVRNGMKNLRNAGEYNNLYQAGFCRAKADWLVGMNGSRLFSVRYRTKLSMGRVQTPTLAMIVKRDNDIKNFVKQKYFTVGLNCGSFIADSDRIDEESKADALVALVNGKTAVVSEVKKEIKTVNPPKLYDLTTLQREANKQFGYTAQQTLKALQELYEMKLATYPRTDSQYLSDDMEQTAEDMVQIVFQVFPQFGKQQTVNVKRCINNSKVTGHHAILPTANISGTDLNTLSDEQKNILMLISAKLIMATAEPHKYESVRVKVTCENHDFTATGRTILENGWKILETSIKSVLKNKNSDSDSEPENIKNLPELTQGQTFDNVSGLKSEHWTSPPKPFTEDTLLSAMEHAGQEDYDEETEKKGLGTPATRAGIIDGLVVKGYAERNKKQITATEKGNNLICVIPDEVKSPKLTAEWENKLKLVENGQYSSESFMNDILGFVKNLCEKYSSIDESVSFGEEHKPIGKCPKCGNNVVMTEKYSGVCTGKCGMIIGRIYGNKLSEEQVKHLLSGEEIIYTAENGKKATILPECVLNEYNGKTFYRWKTGNDLNAEKEPIGKCPKCGNSVIMSEDNGGICLGKCGMFLGKVFGNQLTEQQIKELLSGKEISFTANGRTTVVLPEIAEREYQGKIYYQWKTKSDDLPKEEIGKCPKCGNAVIMTEKYGGICTGKCGMFLGKVYGKILTETQLKTLLSGKETSFTSNGRKTIVVPEVVPNEYQGRTSYQWKTRRDS